LLSLSKTVSHSWASIRLLLLLCWLMGSTCCLQCTQRSFLHGGHVACTQRSFLPSRHVADTQRPFLHCGCVAWQSTQRSPPLCPAFFLSGPLSLSLVVFLLWWSLSIFTGRMNSWRYVLRSYRSVLVANPCPVHCSCNWCWKSTS
jgi:hypothetical protein